MKARYTDTHMIPSDLAFRSLAFDDAGQRANVFLLFRCPLSIITGSHTFVIFNASPMLRATGQIHLDFLPHLQFEI